MCELYSKAEPKLFEQITRSIRIDGCVTSIRLETVFWQLLNDIAQEEQLKLSAFLSRIYTERIICENENMNFSSLLRVACITYLNNKQRISLNDQLLYQLD